MNPAVGFSFFSACVAKGPLALTDASVLSKGLPRLIFSGSRLGLACSCSEQIESLIRSEGVYVRAHVCVNPRVHTRAHRGLSWALWAWWTSRRWLLFQRREAIRHGLFS